MVLDPKRSFGEIGCRGGHLVDQMNYTSDIDLFREWARAVCWKDVRINDPRKYNTAIIFRRAMGNGTINAINGLRKIYNAGQHICVETCYVLDSAGVTETDFNFTMVL